MLFLKQTNDGVIFKIFALPKSSKNMIMGYYEDAIKIKLAAPPVDGAANKMCIKYLSKLLNVPKTSLSIISGVSSRKKQILFKTQDKVKSDVFCKNLTLLVEKNNRSY